jgi:hypothetical protein
MARAKTKLTLDRIERLGHKTPSGRLRGSRTTEAPEGLQTCRDRR